MAARDYYEVLGVPRDADEKAIKNAFRKLTLRYHPDRNKEPGAEDRYKEIAEAYAVLSDPKKRAEYDMRGHRAVEGVSPEDLFRGVDLGDVFGGIDFGFGGDPFSIFFGRRRAGPERGADLRVAIEVPLERIATGGSETVRLGRPTTCPVCGGSGRRDGERCSTCRGGGVVEREETVSVPIPAGAAEGESVRVPGYGLPGRDGGGPGDLLVSVHTRPDSRFERRGADLLRRETVDVLDAVLGGERSVPTLDRPVVVTIPPGTQPGTILRLRGKGLPRRRGGRGDLLVRVGVRVPERLNREERRLYERLRGERPGR